MGKKIGRPKVAKKDAKIVLVGAMLSPGEARSVESSARDANLDKSKWIRKQLLTPSPQVHNPANSNPIATEATLLDSDNQPLSTGSAVFFPKHGTGEFYPQTNFQKIADILPASSLSLKTTAGEVCRLTEADRICQAGNKPPHFHFDYAP